MPKFYVVREWKQTWIFKSRPECQKLVIGFPWAKYKSFETESEANQAFENWPEKYYKNIKKKPNWKTDFQILPFEKNSIAVDAACSGNPGIMEYRGVDLQTWKEIFKKKFETWTNNIGEFLALVHWLAYLKENNLDLYIYSDSKHAINWVNKKKCNTKFHRTDDTEYIFQLIKKAETRLKSNDYTTKILKRDTKDWWEIPADFGRK